VTALDEDLEARLQRILALGADTLPAGEPVPWFGTFRSMPRPSRQRRRLSRKLAVLGVTVSMGLGGTAAAAVIAHRRAAPVTQTDIVRCYSVDSLKGGRNFAGGSIASAGPTLGAQAVNAIAGCTTTWSYGFLTLGSTQVGGTRPPSGRLTGGHPVPPTRGLRPAGRNRRRVPRHRQDLRGSRPTRRTGLPAGPLTRPLSAQPLASILDNSE
jgi:hypothetical protein